MSSRTPSLIRVFVFVSGAILMSLEMLGSRLLAPQYGNSIVVWASIISVFLAGLSAGYWLGGLLADRWPSMNGVAAVLTTAGVLILIIPIAAPLVFGLMPAASREGSLLASIVLFLVPSIMMGSVSPYAIRLEAAALERLGRSAGQLYAISTAGSIVGTIATAFWLIPLAGVNTLTYSLGLALLLQAAVIGLFAGSGQRVARLAVATAAGAVLIIGGVIGATELRSGWFSRVEQEERKVILEKDSFYHHILVVDENDMRSLQFDNLIQSAISLKNPYESRARYSNYLHLPIAMQPAAEDVLVIGLGGGTAPKQFLRDYPYMRVDVAEIDPAVIDVAQKYFAFPPSHPRLRVFPEDGRRLLERVDRKYDAIILDAYNRDFIPFHLVTKEFFQLCKRKLKPRGLVAVNVIGAHTGRASGSVGSVYQTLGEVFSERYTFVVDYRRDTRIAAKTNCIIVAGTDPQMTESQLQATIAAARGKVSGEYLRLAGDYMSRGPQVSLAKIFTDQYAPVEEMLAK